MKISVVIPLYNKARYVVRAVNSVLSQSYNDFELIIVNDGSTDGGERLISDIKDPRLHLVNQSNAGVSAARNRGINEAAADHIAFLDADDEWKKGFLESMLNLHSKHPNAGLFASAYEIFFPKIEKKKLLP